MRGALWTLLWIASGCGKPVVVSNKLPANPHGDAKATSPSVTSHASFERGIALTPSDKLIAWLDGQKRNGQPWLVRIPLMLRRGAVGFELRGARVGTASDALEVLVSDVALGVGLADRARFECAPTANYCGFAAEGYWRGNQEERYQFDVTKANYLAIGELANIYHAEVEVESGN